jgi:transcriptional regulator GlxA family with amidase domain
MGGQTAAMDDMTSSPQPENLVVAVLIAEGVTASDAVNPAEALAVIPGVSVRFVGSEKGPKRTVPGPFKLVADYTFEDIPSPDVILVPYDQSSMADERTLAWLRSAHETARWTTSVCAGAITLAAAGLLSGRRATTHWMTRGLLAAFGATYVPERWVQDGNIITAAGNSAGIDMALFLTSELAGPAVAQAVQLGMEYDPQPPFDSGSLAKAKPETVELCIEMMTAAMARAGTPPEQLAMLAQAAGS